MALNDDAMLPLILFIGPDILAGKVCLMISRHMGAEHKASPSFLVLVLATLVDTIETPNAVGWSNSTSAFAWQKTAKALHAA